MVPHKWRVLRRTSCGPKDTDSGWSQGRRAFVFHDRWVIDVSDSGMKGASSGEHARRR